MTIRADFLPHEKRQRGSGRRKAESSWIRPEGDWPEESRLAEGEWPNFFPLRGWRSWGGSNNFPLLPPNLTKGKGMRCLSWVGDAAEESFANQPCLCKGMPCCRRSCNHGDICSRIRGCHPTSPQGWNDIIAIAVYLRDRLVRDRK